MRDRYKIILPLNASPLSLDLPLLLSCPSLSAFSWIKRAYPLSGAEGSLASLTSGGSGAAASSSCRCGGLTVIDDVCSCLPMSFLLWLLGAAAALLLGWSGGQTEEALCGRR